MATFLQRKTFVLVWNNKRERESKWKTRANENLGNKVQGLLEICWCNLQDTVRIFLRFVKGLGRFDPVLHFDCSSLLHKWDSSRPNSPICCFLMLFIFFFVLPESLRHAEPKALENPTDQNKHQLVKSPWNWMSIMQHKMQKDFKPPYFRRPLCKTQWKFALTLSSRPAFDVLQPESQS